MAKKGNSSVVNGRLRHKYYATRRSLVEASLIPKKRILEELEQAAQEDNGKYVWLRHCDCFAMV